ncbi:hypothetical protein N9F24_01240 [Akkermansiaceae bacterium]|nr:hypothetical protein [Akkermansiaceae bacterium]MDA8967309.1 hypothetical protein [Akkermansiaceae bacterium]MDB4545657.1 hypothetical protein [Akkermansiaceae bacterium]
MANKEHVKILLKGAKEWNQWRQTHSERPDLTHADFHGAYLHGVTLHFSKTDDLCHAEILRSFVMQTDSSS